MCAVARRATAPAASRAIRAQTSLVGNDGLIVKKQFDTTDKFVTAFMNAAPHAGFKDDPNQNLTPARLGNIYAYFIAQMSG